MDWYFSQMKGTSDEEINEGYWLSRDSNGSEMRIWNSADIISCLEFDHTGEFVATGDKGGRVVVFKRNHNVIAHIYHDGRWGFLDRFHSLQTDGRLVDYIVHCTFTSHEPEFDYLKSLEIEEKINKIKWLPQGNDARFLLSTNGEIRLLLVYWDMGFVVISSHRATVPNIIAA